MKKKGQIKTGLFLRLVGATLTSIGFYFVAFNQSVIGAILVGIGGIMMALGGAI